MINGVNTSRPVTQNYTSEGRTGKGKANDKVRTKADEAAVVLELGKQGEDSAVTYPKPTVKTAASTEPENKNTTKINAEEINRLWAETNRATENLRNMVEQLLKSQGKTFEDVLAGREELIVDEKTRAAAQEAISENGEWGVNAVSDRIVAFAKALADDNPEMYDKLMSAIDEGFAQAEKAFGGQLPDICRQTYDEIHRKMDEWKSGKNTVTAETDLNS